MCKRYLFGKNGIQLGKGLDYGPAWEFFDYGEGVPSGAPNPGPISDQKHSFFTPVFRPGF